MILPEFRTEIYAKWKACERFGLLPPDIESTWDNNNVWGQAFLLAFSMIRDMEEASSGKVM